MAGTLETFGATVTDTTATLSSYDRIVVSTDNTTSAVGLALSDTGTLDLTVALEGERAATVTASDFGNTITGGAQGDTFYGGAGDDTLNGGDGDDTLFGSTDGSETDADILNGGAGNDTITDNGGTVAIDGGAGDDRILLSSGVADGTVEGGEGRDVLGWNGLANLGTLTIQNVEVLETAGANFTATVEQFEAFDKIAVYDDPSWASSTVTLTLADAGSLDLAGELEGERAATVFASAFGNTITGGTLGDTLYGGAGDDTLNGGDGDDTLFGSTDGSETAADSLNGGAGNDTITDYGGTVAIDGGTGDDRILLGSSATGGTVEGGEGRDVLGWNGVTNLGTLTIQNVEVLKTAGSNFTATVEQFEAFDKIAVYDDPSWASSTVTLTLADAGSLDLAGELEGVRSATVTASAFGNTITGGTLADTLYGGAGDDTLNGGDGDDTLFSSTDGSETAADILNGGAGKDTITDYGGTVAIDGGTGDDHILLGSGVTGGTVEGGEGRDVLGWSGVTDLGTLTIQNVEVLETAGANFTATVEQFEAFDKIAVYDDAGWASSAVMLTLANAGSLDLAGELEGERAATVFASDFGNTITGGAKGDVFYGGAGADTLDGAAGNDTLYGGANSDTLNGGDGDDTLFGSTDGNETDADVLNGGAGNDTITDYGGTVAIDGGTGDDHILLGYGVTGGTVEGGEGRDVLGWSGVTDLGTLTIQNVEVLETAGANFTATVEQFEAFDKIAVYDDPSWASSTVTLTLADAGSLDLAGELEGMRGAQIFASDFGNTITGGAQGDVFYGGAGADTLDGAAGNDTLYGGANSDMLNGGDGDDTLFGSTDGNETDADVLNGGAGNDSITDYGGTVAIDGGTGDDRILLGSGVTGGTVEGGEGRDVLSWNGATDLRALTIQNVEVLETGGANITATVEQFEAFDKIAVNDDPSSATSTVTLTLADAGSLDLADELEGVRGATVFASAFGNTITGGAQGDTLYGGAGADTLNGAAGNDTLYGDYSTASSSADTLNGGDGDDTLFGSTDGGEIDADILNGGAGNDSITDYGGTVAIDGGTGDDRIILGYGVTGGTVEGGEGRDVLTWNGMIDLTALTIQNVEVLETGGSNFTAAVEQFQAFDKIAVLDDPFYNASAVTLTLADAGSLDLTEALEGVRGATVYGSDFGNTITGGAQADTFYGGVGSDTLNGAGGDDRLDGGDGNDTAVYAGNYLGYTIAATDGGLTVTGEGTDTLSNIETLRFADGTYDVASGRFTPALVLDAPSLTLTKAVLGPNGGVVLTIDGLATAGKTVDIRVELPSGAVSVLATPVAGTGGRFSVTLPEVGPFAGLTAFEVPVTAVVREGAATSPVSNTVLVEAGTSAEIGGQLADFAGEAGLSAILFTDRPNLVFATKAELDAARSTYGAVLDKIVGDYSMTVFRQDAAGRTSEIYDETGHLRAVATVLANGDTTALRYDATGLLIGKTFRHDGLREEFAYAIKDKPYASQHAVYDATGKLVSMDRFYADGDPAFSEVHRTDGTTAITGYTEDGARTSQLFGTNGKLVSTERADADGTVISTELRSPDGTREVRSYDGDTGAETSSIVRHPDGSVTTANHVVTGKAYAEQIASYDAAGKLVSMERYYGDDARTLAFSEVHRVDGSSEVHNYDTSGRETVGKFIDKAGEGDLFQYAYVGAGTTPSTTTHTSYAANGTREHVDVTLASGSHVQTAFASGVEILSTRGGVADTIKGFAGGSDLFVFGPDSGRDVVTNFETGTARHDVLWIDVGYATDFASLSSKMSQVGADTLVKLDAEDSFLLKGVLLSSLTADHVQFGQYIPDFELP